MYCFSLIPPVARPTKDIERLIEEVQRALLFTYQMVITPKIEKRDRFPARILRLSKEGERLVIRVARFIHFTQWDIDIAKVIKRFTLANGVLMKWKRTEQDFARLTH